MNQPLFGDLTRNGSGQLSYLTVDGRSICPVIPVRAFPISAPLDGLSLVDSEGHEVVWIEQWNQLAPSMQTLLLDELAHREFMPEIQRITAVSSFSTPNTWHVDTNKGSTEFVLNGEEHIRRLSDTMLLIADSHSIFYLIRDVRSLDRISRKHLDRFL